MNNCNERNFDDLLSVLAIPVEGLVWRTATARLRATIAPDDYTFTGNAIYVGRNGYSGVCYECPQPAYSLGIVPESGDVSDEEKMDAGGRIHHVTVKFDVSTDNASAREALLRLERGEWVLELCFFGDTETEPCRALVQATRDTCLVTSKRDGKTVSVTIEIENLTGLQIIE
ncbi:MAG: hypothetical protein IJ767_03910 [Bacteroidaceae bacterium]|nr:hypothetical protein [Bacteroidaceae bacterium]